VRTAMECLMTSSETLLTASGRPRYGFFRSVVKTIWIVAGMPIGYTLWGMKGFVWAVALVEVPAAFVIWYGCIRTGVFRMHRELLAFGLFGLGVAIGHLFRKPALALLSELS